MKHIFIFFTVVLISFSAICPVSVNAGGNYPAFKKMFIQAESSAIKKRTEVKGFLDPIGNNELYYNILKAKYPILISGASKNRYEILRLFQDRGFKRDIYTESDILILLCTLCLDDYVEMMDSARSLVVRKELNFEILDKIIFQDFNLTNQVARNYKNIKLQEVLNALKCDIVNEKVFPNKNSKDYITQINTVLSGEYWEKIKQEEQISPPLIAF